MPAVLFHICKKWLQGWSNPSKSTDVLSFWENLMNGGTQMRGEMAGQPVALGYVMNLLNASKNKSLWIHLFFTDDWTECITESPFYLLQHLTILQHCLPACQFVFSTCFLSSTMGETAHLIRNILILLFRAIFEMFGFSSVKNILKKLKKLNKTKARLEFAEAHSICQYYANLYFSIIMD